MERFILRLVREVVWWGTIAQLIMVTLFLTIRYSSSKPARAHLDQFNRRLDWQIKINGWEDE